MCATHRTSVVVVHLFAINVNLQLVLTTMAAMLLMLSDAQQLPPSPPLLSALVPKIYTNNVKLTPDGNQYNLRIVTNGSARDETVELRAPGTHAQELHVKGKLIENYVPGLQLILMYEAGKDGYVVKYVFKQLPLSEPVPQLYELSGPLLKSSTG